MMLSPIEAVWILLGRPSDPRYAYKFPVHTEPCAWRCSRCGGAMMLSPQRTLFTHSCEGRGRPSRRLRYMGLRTHAHTIWGSVWRNRPRLVSGQPRHAPEPSKLEPIVPPEMCPSCHRVPAIDGIDVNWPTLMGSGNHTWYTGCRHWSEQGRRRS